MHNAASVGGGERRVVALAAATVRLMRARSCSSTKDRSLFVGFKLLDECEPQGGVSRRVKFSLGSQFWVPIRRAKTAPGALCFSAAAGVSPDPFGSGGRE
jgi:hypothetical protein